MQSSNFKSCPVLVQEKINFTRWKLICIIIEDKIYAAHKDNTKKMYDPVVDVSRYYMRVNLGSLFAQSSSDKYVDAGS